MANNVRESLIGLPLGSSSSENDESDENDVNDNHISGIGGMESHQIISGSQSI
jgi:hypothetical protein